MLAEQVVELVVSVVDILVVEQVAFAEQVVEQIVLVEPVASVEQVDFIWADVQGAERELIEGGLKVINNTNYIYIEFYNEEMYEGQLNLKDMLCLLPQFKIVKKFGNNVLLKNGRKKDEDK